MKAASSEWKSLADRWSARKTRIDHVEPHLLGFDGVVIVDDFNMKAISEHYSFEEAVRLAINAGADIILQGNVVQYREDAAEFAQETIVRLVSRGAIPEEQVEQSYRRIMRLKSEIPSGA